MVIQVLTSSRQNLLLLLLRTTYCIVRIATVRLTICLLKDPRYLKVCAVTNKAALEIPRQSFARGYALISLR